MNGIVLSPIDFGNTCVRNFGTRNILGITNLTQFFYTPGNAGHKVITLRISNNRRHNIHYGNEIHRQFLKLKTLRRY